MIFWALAAVVTLGSLLVVVAPLLRGGAPAERRAAYDLQVYRDQLREIDRDVARGVIGPHEAEGSRIEISRKLLAAADAAAEGTTDGGADLGADARADAGADAGASRDSRPGARARLVPLALLAGALGLTGLLYATNGAPGHADQPLARRLTEAAEARAARPAQAEVEAVVARSQAEAAPGAAPEPGPAPGAAPGPAPEPAPGPAPGAAPGPAPGAAPGPAPGAAPGPSPDELALVDRLQALLADRPDDLEGHRLLVRSLGALGRFAEARAAQERVVEILGPEADADALVGLAELMIAAAAGYVSPEAEAALSRALSLDPSHPPGRYYSGLTLLQGGRPDLAHRLWSGLLEEGPPDAPWVRAIAMEIEAVSALAGLPVPGAGAGAGGMSPTLPEGDADTMAMIEGMVASLGGRLAAEGGTATEWGQLIRSLGVLGRIGEAAAIWSEAQEVFAGDAPALAGLREAARDARLIQ